MSAKSDPQFEMFDAQPQRKRIAYRETSRAAWNSMTPTVTGELNTLIVEAIRAAGPEGITCQAIEDKIGRTHESVSGNLRHLVENGFVRCSDEYGKTRSGHKAHKWVVVR